MVLPSDLGSGLDALRRPGHNEGGILLSMLNVTYESGERRRRRMEELKREGVNLYREGLVKEAVGRFRQAAGMIMGGGGAGAGDMGIWDLLGIALHRQGDVEGAIEAFERAAGMGGCGGAE